MGLLFEELDHQITPMGDISLRRRWEPNLDIDVYEAKLGDEFLMSSLFTVAEIALGNLGLAAIDGTGPDGARLDVVVGGLGLGYTARGVLDDERVGSLRVIEALGEVVSWHERRLLPLSAGLVDDPRCSLVVGDFFDLVRSGGSFGPAGTTESTGSAGTDLESPGGPDQVHAVLVDIDHAPDRLLHPSHADFYAAEGLAPLLERLRPDGVFALWSDDPPDPVFVSTLGEVFAGVEAHDVSFANPLTGGESSNTIYVATAPT